MKEHKGKQGGPAELLKIPEVASICKVTRWTVKNWIKAGKLRAIRLGGPRTVRISEEALREFFGKAPGTGRGRDKKTGQKAKMIREK